MRTAKFLDIIKSFSGYLRIDNKAGYNDEYAIGDLGDKDFIPKKVFIEGVPGLLLAPFIYNLPANSKTPIIVNFANDTIKFGTDAAIAIGTNLGLYEANQDNVIYKRIDADDDTITYPYNNVSVLAEQWTDNTYTILESITILPDTDTGDPGGLTVSNINMIIKP